MLWVYVHGVNWCWSWLLALNRSSDVTEREITQHANRDDRLALGQPSRCLVPGPISLGVCVSRGQVKSKEREIGCAEAQKQGVFGVS